MENRLFFTCGFQGKNDWIVLSNRQLMIDKDKEKMLDMLNKIKTKVGGARLEIIPEPELGPSELSVQYDGEKYLFTLLEYVGPNGEMIIRGKANFNGEWKLVEFLSDGELYPPDAITTDFEFIKKVFLEFLETGNVSYDLMDRIY
ncbi:hypothetical protein [Rodentibacter sp. Ppn85]|uniref:DUF6911 family protein n=1 Tax=Rodentibacter sp. Ppn85 TaxID=1908525 RepID=UPI000986ACE8|nr:hypothetical protein [Rodentibacter sp. Ppn85]OOF60299.1 hypothetical protein BKL51_11530 [Rodentibacter sp. Ppn85]